MMRTTGTVGDHYGADKQAHIPKDVLDAMNADPGDTLQFTVVRGECTIKRVDRND